MRVRTKDELTKLERNKGHTTDYIGSLWESPNLMQELRIATHPFIQLDLHGLFLDVKLNIAWVHITKNGQQ